MRHANQCDRHWKSCTNFNFHLLSNVGVLCAEIGQVEHATRVLTGTDGGKNVLGTKATFTCHANYRMPANVDATRTCQADGTWSGTQPRCVGMLKHIQAQRALNLIDTNI